MREVELDRHNYVIITPMYNGRLSGDIYRTLPTLEDLAEKGHPMILVDDGSEDDTPNYLRKYEKENDSKIHFLYQEKNGLKIGALRAAAEQANDLLGYEVDYVVCLDDDSSIENPETLDGVVRSLENDPEAAGGAFRLIPKANKNSFAVKMQRLQYLIANSMRKFSAKKGMCNNAAGAGNIYDKEVFIEEAKRYPGVFFQGDDYQITTQTLSRKDEGKQKYKMRYFNNVLVTTQVPNTIKDHYKKLREWFVGDLNVKLGNKAGFIAKNIPRNRYGVVSVWEYFGWGLLGASLAGAAYGFGDVIADYLQNFDFDWDRLANYFSESYSKFLLWGYGIGLGIASALTAYNEEEIENPKETLALLPLVPFYYGPIGLVAKLGAIKDKIKSRKRK